MTFQLQSLILVSCSSWCSRTSCEGSDHPLVCPQIRDEYAAASEEFKPRALPAQTGGRQAGPAVADAAAPAAGQSAEATKSVTARLIESMPETSDRWDFYEPAKY